MKDPNKLAFIIFSSLDATQKEKVRNNLPYYGKSIFKSLDYTPQQKEQFINKLGELLNV